MAAYRRKARINSVLIVGSNTVLETVLPYGIAPDHDRVRLLELRHPARVTLAAGYQAVRHPGRDRKDRPT